jgi:hypothetical protein
MWMPSVKKWLPLDFRDVRTSFKFEQLSAIKLHRNNKRRIYKIALAKPENKDENKSNHFPSFKILPLCKWIE